MKDFNGKNVRIGDRVRLWDQVLGTVVCDFDEQKYSELFQRESWMHLKVGLLIEIDNGKLIYYPDSDEDFEIVSSEKG
jgi:hypothetical protein